MGESMTWRTPFSWPPGRKTRSYGSSVNLGYVHERGFVLAMPFFIAVKALQASWVGALQAALKRIVQALKMLGNIPRSFE